MKKTAQEVISIQSLHFREANFSYSTGAKIFSNLNYELPMGRNILVCGPPGNGQSTFLKLLAVMVQPQSGEYLINGLNTTDMSFEEFLPFRKKIGYTFDYNGLFANRTLHDNLALPLMYHKSCEPQQVTPLIREFAEEFGFVKQLVQRPAEVSGGLRKLVIVLRSFIMRPEMIVMDDPFAGIDQESTKKLMNLIDDRKKNNELKHVFLTSRDEALAERLGVERLIIDAGIPRLESRLERTA
jgi:ABC-type transporter Mla maintaining outer membrane lipid asymmetry ATPase subunit MlaF